MSTIDIVAIGLIALFAVTGLFSGFVAQILRICALVIATLLATQAPNIVPSIFPAKTEGREIFVHVFTIVSIWIVTYTVLAIISSVIVKHFHKAAPALTVLDRIIGFLLGAIKGLLFVYIILCILTLMSEKLESKGFIPKEEVAKSFTWKYVQEHNVMKGRIAGLP